MSWFVGVLSGYPIRRLIMCQVDFSQLTDTRLFVRLLDV